MPVPKSHRDANRIPSITAELYPCKATVTSSHKMCRIRCVKHGKMSAIQGSLAERQSGKHARGKAGGGGRGARLTGGACGERGVAGGAGGTAAGGTADAALGVRAGSAADAAAAEGDCAACGAALALRSPDPPAHHSTNVIADRRRSQ